MTISWERTEEKGFFFFPFYEDAKDDDDDDDSPTDLNEQPGLVKRTGGVRIFSRHSMFKLKEEDEDDDEEEEKEEEKLMINFPRD